MTFVLIWIYCLTGIGNATLRYAGYEKSSPFKVTFAILDFVLWPICLGFAIANLTLNLRKKDGNKTSIDE